MAENNPVNTHSEVTLHLAKTTDASLVRLLMEAGAKVPEIKNILRQEAAASKQKRRFIERTNR